MNPFADTVITTLTMPPAASKDLAFSFSGGLFSPELAQIGINRGSAQQINGVGAFVRIFAEEGRIYLQGGTVSGGHEGGPIEIDHYEVGGSNIVPGRKLYLRVRLTALVIDGLMYPGATLVNASLQTGSSIPSDHSFSVTNKTGDIHAEIGVWTDTEFLPSGPAGNFVVFGCPGSFTLRKAGIF